MLKKNPKTHSFQSLLQENALLYEEVLVARKASELTAKLVVEQFVKMEELLQRLEANVATEHELRTSLAEKLHEAEIREAELAEARVAAEAANEAKSAFLASVSHELRTPLNAIIGYSEMLIEDAEDQQSNELISDLQRIHTAGKQLLTLIDSILDLSKVESGKMELYLETFAVADMLEETIQIIQPLVEHNANTLHVECAADIGKMYADQAKVRQALCNLLSNACKFTERGHITLTVNRQSSTWKAGEYDWLIFQVRDTGIGMTREQTAKLFQAFTQADASTFRKFGGTGLGLTISKRFCEMMGGDISVHSEYGKGTVFSIMLPATVTKHHTGVATTQGDSG